MSKLDVTILHQDYVLTCPDGQEAQLLEAVERVDQQFQKMRDSSKLRAREHVAVLLAVNLAFENLKLREQLLDLQQQLSSQLSNEDGERLQTLEALLAQEQAQAEQLLQRLDQALETEPSSADEAQAQPSLDNDNGVELPAAPQEPQ